MCYFSVMLAQTILSIKFSGVVVALLIAVGLLIVRERRRDHWYGAGIFICLALTFLSGYLFANNTINPKYPVVFGYFLIPRFLIGPLAFFYFRSMFLDEPIPNSIALRHLLPTLVIGVAGLPFLFAELMVVFDVSAACGICSMVTGTDTISWLRLACQLHVGAYLVPIIIFIFRALPGIKEESKGALTWAATLLSFCTLVVLLDFLGSFIYTRLMWTTAAVLMIAIIWMALLVGFRYPQLMNLIKDQTMQMKVRPNLLRGVDPNELERKLRLLMEEEKVYCDEDLQVNRVAGMLGIKPYRLTYFLNHNLNKNFSQYINEYRVNEAKRILVEAPDRTIIHIASAAGFNSKTVFYKKFSEYTGMAPTEYRKLYLQKSAV